VFLTDLGVAGFRNHPDSRLSFSQNVSIFFGRNGQGKTNLLDSVYFLTLTKSFQVSSDLLCIRNGDPHFTLSGSFRSDSGLVSEIRTQVFRPEGKQISLNGQKITGSSDIIGRFPTVLFSLEDRLITMGSPSDRRKFLDSVLFQTSKVYIEDSRKLKKTIRQRNDLLQSPGKLTPSVIDLFEVWTEELIRNSAPVLRRRLRFLQEFRQLLAVLYQKELSGFEQPEIGYKSDETVLESDSDAEDWLREQARIYRDQELDRRTTLIGPQRDDLLILLDGKETRFFASQGQHKLLLLAVKIAMWQYLKEKTGETPIVLIDDIFSELDSERLKVISGFLPTLGQVFITMTDREKLALDGNFGFFRIEDGRVYAG